MSVARTSAGHRPPLRLRALGWLRASACHAWTAFTLLVLTAGVLGCGSSRVSRDPFVLLLTSDTLRADRLGAYGSTLGATPHLDALFAGSLVFESAYAPCSYTLPSVSALLTGRHPEELGMQRNISRLPAQVSTLASVLQLHGFRTGAAVSNWVLRSGTGLERGFDLYDDRFPQNETNREMPERVAEQTTDAALAVLDRLAAGPAFLWVHYQDPHGPYTPPPGHREAHLDAERSRPDAARELDIGGGGFGGIPAYQVVPGPRTPAWYRAGYDGEVSYLDSEVGRLLDGLSERGLRERAVVVFTADHGEALGEDDYWFAHGALLSEPLVRVPLAIRVPGREPERRADPASLLEIFPTLLSAVGVDVPDGYAGRDLLAGTEGAPPIHLVGLRGSRRPRFGLVDGDWHYLREESTEGRRESLHRRGDPERDHSATDPDVLARLSQKLDRVRAGVNARPEERQVLGDEERAHLRALGYVDDAETD